MEIEYSEDEDGQQIGHEDSRAPRTHQEESRQLSFITHPSRSMMETSTTATTTTANLNSSGPLPQQLSFRSRMSRRRASTGAESTATSVSVSSVVGNGHMTEGEQEERRRQIKSIMQNTGLSQQEKSRSIQSLMDGRQRRCSINSTVSVGTTQSTAHSYVSNMSRVAAAASEYYNNNNNNNNNHDTTVGVQQQQQQQQQHPDATHHQQQQQQQLLDLHQYRDDRSVASSVTDGSAAYGSSENDDHHYNAPAQEGTEPNHVPYRQYHGRSRSLQDWTDTDRVTAAPWTTVCNPAGVSRLMEQSRPECPHYKRNCTLVSPCCGLAFGCRICHDDCPVLPPPMQRRRGSVSSTPAHHAQKVVERRRSMPIDSQLEHENEDTHHLIDRFAVKEVICRRCYLRQSSKTYVPKHQKHTYCHSQRIFFRLQQQLHWLRHPIW